VLLVAIGIVSTGAIYYWLVGSITPPETTPTMTNIQVHKFNSTMLKITNTGVSDTGELAEMSTTGGDCTFAAPVVLEQGVTYSCTLAAPVTGETRVWAEGVNTAVVYL
jgi:hypothetical protein